MGAFYRIDYAGASDVGAGTIALANGKLAGLDVGGGLGISMAGARRLS